MGMNNDIATVALEDAAEPVNDPVVNVPGVLGKADYGAALP